MSMNAYARQGSSGESPRILVVDDTPSIHEDFRKILAPSRVADSEAFSAIESVLFGDVRTEVVRPAYRVDSAYGGEEAWKAAQQAYIEGAPYSLAFIDVRMPPGIDGLETAKRLWESDPDIEIVICTAYSDHSWDEFYAEFGGTDRLLILKKPFDSAEVMQISSSLTRKWRTGKELKAMMAALGMRVKEAGDALNVTNSRLDLIMSSMNEGVCGVDLENRVTFINPALARLCGKPEAELRGAPADHFIDAEVFYDLKRNLGNTSTSADGVLSGIEDARILHKDGSTISVEVERCPIKENGRVTGSVMTVRDVSEKRTLQKQLIQAQKMEAIGQLASGIAHEINNPLSYIIGNLDTLSQYVGLIQSAIEVFATAIAPARIDDSDPGKDPEKLRGIAGDLPNLVAETLDGAHRVKGIVEGLKFFARGENDKKQAMDVNNIIETSLKLVNHQLKYKCRIATDLLPLPEIQGYPNELAQVFVNLLTNAAQAIPEHGHITIHSRVKSGRVVISVKDDGMGISPENLQKLFTPFFTTKPVGQGTGLGLSISYGIVKRHGGDIVVESERGKGTTFTVFLPIALPHPDGLIFH